MENIETNQNEKTLKTRESVVVKNLNSKTETIKDVPSVRLTPEQIEEIHVDEYSLSLFYATRMEPLTLLEIKRQFAEPEAKKAQSVMDRFLKAGLIHITSDGRYYSNFPENYINYANYRYDHDLEAKKDAKVFEIMKEQTGKLEFWKDKTYFSMDGFYSEEQTQEILDLFKLIKLKSKDFANQNSKKKNLKGLKFRRIKFYDMTFSFLLMLFIGLGVLTHIESAFAGGNDPSSKIAMKSMHGGGNDPTSMTAMTKDFGGGGHDPEGTIKDGGGGHDPEDKSCLISLDKKKIKVSNKVICKAFEKLMDELAQSCSSQNSNECDEWFYEYQDLLLELDLLQNN